MRLSSWKGKARSIIAYLLEDGLKSITDQQLQSMFKNTKKVVYYRSLSENYRLTISQKSRRKSRIVGYATRERWKPEFHVFPQFSEKRGF